STGTCKTRATCRSRTCGRSATRSRAESARWSTSSIGGSEGRDARAERRACRGRPVVDGTPWERRERERKRWRAQRRFAKRSGGSPRPGRPRARGASRRSGSEGGARLSNNHQSARPRSEPDGSSRHNQMSETVLITGLAAILVFTPLVLVLLDAGLPLRPPARTDAVTPRDPEEFEREIRRRLYGDPIPDHVSPVAMGVPTGGDRLRIAVIAPPWIPVPPPGYGGIEAVLDLLCAALVRRGHDVTLFAAPGSRSPATVITPLEQTHPDEIERALYEADHVARAFALIEDGAPGERPYDVVHDHCGFTAVAMANRIRLPVVHTLH